MATHQVQEVIDEPLIEQSETSYTEGLFAASRMHFTSILYAVSATVAAISTRWRVHSGSKPALSGSLSHNPMTTVIFESLPLRQLLGRSRT